MKEKATYRRFDLFAILAILGCIGMLCFEAIFIFELYDRAPSQVLNLTPVPSVAPVSAANPPLVETPAVTPVNAPVETDKATDHREPVEPVEPVVVPVG